MTTILAAIDNSRTANAVLATAVALGQAALGTPQALHVRENGNEHARAATEAAGVALREVTGSVVEQIEIAATDPEVRVVVVGARRDPAGTRPAGHVALELLTTVRAPLVVVPPDVHSPGTIRHMLVPLDGTMTTARRARDAIDLATSGNVEVTLIHACDEDHLPLFTDQPQHDTQSFVDEFLDRCEVPTSARLELRVGSAADEILTAATALEADLLAIAWGQTLEPGRARVVKELLARSRVPLLLLPLQPAASPVKGQ